MKKIAFCVEILICLLLVILNMQVNRVKKEIAKVNCELKEKIDSTSKNELEFINDKTNEIEWCVQEKTFDIKAILWGDGDEKKFMQSLFPNYGKK